MKSGFWQIQIAESDRYKTAFTVPFGHYEWNVMPFGLKNAPSEFQNIMNDIFTPYTTFIIVYIDDVLVFSKTIDQHFKHLQIFLQVIEKNGLAVSASKMLLFQTKTRFLGHDIYQGTIKPIQRSLAFANKFPDEIKDKKQLRRFLGCLNYVSIFFPHLKHSCAPLYKRLRKSPKPWTDEHIIIVKQVKNRIQSLPCLHIPIPTASMIVETDASDIGYGGILKQKFESYLHEQLVRFHFGLSLGPQQNYSTIKREILSIVLCITKFQDDLFFKKFLIRIDCKSAKEILQKDVKNLVSKQIFARWQAILLAFDFEIELSKEIAILFRIFSCESFCKEIVTNFIFAGNKMSSSKNKGKYKGKGIRRAEDYQLEVPAQIPHLSQLYVDCAKRISSYVLYRNVQHSHCSIILF